MKKCELCKFPATSYCESDEAHLCWGCDDKVHGANFLVARHTRTLLCRNCQSLTPWKASGPKLGHTASVCYTCVNDSNFKEQLQEEDESEADNEDCTDADSDLAAVHEGCGINGEIQVVPLSPPAASSSSSSSCTSNQELGRSISADSSVDGMKSLKRTLNNNTDSSSGRISRRRREIGNQGRRGGESICVDSSSPLKELQAWVKSHSRSA